MEEGEKVKGEKQTAKIDQLNASLWRRFTWIENTRYAHRVKCFTRKNKTKIIKTFNRSSKRMRKTRQMTPQAMWRHMTGEKRGEELLHAASDTQRKTSSDRMRGRQSDKQGKRVRETTQKAMSIAQSINMLDVCHFLLFCDPILTERYSSVQIYLKSLTLFVV